MENLGWCLRERVPEGRFSKGNQRRASVEEACSACHTPATTTPPTPATFKGRRRSLSGWGSPGKKRRKEKRTYRVRGNISCLTNTWMYPYRGPNAPRTHSRGRQSTSRGEGTIRLFSQGPHPRRQEPPAPGGCQQARKGHRACGFVVSQPLDTCTSIGSRAFVKQGGAPDMDGPIMKSGGRQGGRRWSYANPREPSDAQLFLPCLATFLMSGSRVDPVPTWETSMHSWLAVGCGEAAANRPTSGEREQRLGSVLKSSRFFQLWSF